MALTSRPNATAAGLGGAIAVLVIWVLTLFGVDPPPEVAAAIATLASALTVELRHVVKA